MLLFEVVLVLWLIIKAQSRWQQHEVRSRRTRAVLTLELNQPFLIR